MLRSKGGGSFKIRSFDCVKVFLRWGSFHSFFGSCVMNTVVCGKSSVAAAEKIQSKLSIKKVDVV